MHESEPTLRLDDLDAASFLLAEGCRLERVERDESSGFRIFCLAGERVAELVDSFARGDAVVRLDLFLAARRGLLDLIHRAERVRR